MAFDNDLRDQTASGLYVPGEFYSPNALEPGGVVIDNRSGLDDDAVRHAVATYFEDNVASFGYQNTFQTYSNDVGGSVLARTKFEAPSNVFDEIRLARDLASKDDDIRATIGAMVAMAYRDGMENFSKDEETQILFNKLARSGNFDYLNKQIYQEYLIAQQVTTVSLYTSKNYDFTHAGVSRQISRQVASPLVGVLRSESIRVLGDDMFNNAPLAYIPENQKIREWLEKYFAKSTTAATRAQMAREQPVWAALFLEKVAVPNDITLLSSTLDGYRLNPRMVKRMKAPCLGPYPRPLLTADFALLEAKRLLNLLDWSFLQGGVNFLVIAKKGTDTLPGQPEEIENLREVLRRSSRSGVIVGDHRLNIEIVTPDLKEMLNPAKRKMLARQLSATMLRLAPGAIEEGTGGEGEKAAIEMITAVITSDRNDVKRHIESIYEDTVDRNPKIFTSGAAKIWHQKIVLQGLQFFSELVLKLNDRGAIPRKYAVEVGGFDYEAAVSEKQREAERGDDEVMVPPQIPFSSPNTGPQDNNDGRPTNTNAPDSAKPRLTLVKNPGETIKAEYDEELDQVIRYGELTAAILEEFPDHKFGRMTKVEQEAIAAEGTFQKGPVIVVPVNPRHKTAEHRAVRLDDTSVSLIVGQTRAGAIVTRALCFRDEAFSIAQAEDRAIAWGFEIELKEEPDSD